jgi:NAD(P)-dependent dehydrogenase (short-subunit alcohol dehydrogenase family)
MGMFDLTGKVALVTGGSMGLGLTFTDVLAENGADIAITARSAELLEENAKGLRERHGRKVTCHAGDVTSETDVARVVAEALEQHGRIDILINNAGISDLRSGSIINISSILGSGGSEFVNPWYVAAKGAVLQMTKHLAVEWADRNVRVNAIAPAYFVTEMTRPLFEMLGMAPWIESRTPMRRLGDPEADLRGPLLFLASEAASYVTGHTLFVDGGWEASRGAWQIEPSHFSWNKDFPQAGSPYPGIVPNEFEQWKSGIPGIHFPMPEGA